MVRYGAQYSLERFGKVTLKLMLVYNMANYYH